MTLSSFLRIQARNTLVICICSMLQSLTGANDPIDPNAPSRYTWTTDHMHVGVRWQPFVGRPGNNLHDARRPVIAEHSSYAQFWVSWAAAEPSPGNIDYARHLSSYLVAIEEAIDICVAEGIKVEMVFWHCPSWASVTGKRGAWKPKVDHYNAFVKRIATHFKGRVDAYQLYHEANLKGMMEDGDIDFLMSEIFIKGARVIRDVYAAPPSKPVLVSTSGCSPCEACPSLAGLKGSGALAVEDYYRRLIGNKELMDLVDGLNMNVSDNFNGYGMMDGDIIPNVWTQYDLIRGQLDASQYLSKKVLSSESWIIWDDSGNSHDVNGDGAKNEKDAYDKAVTILGNLLDQGLNTINLPWSDNSSPWSMGLTKRRDYNGRVKKFAPEKVIAAADGGTDIVTRKVGLRGGDENFSIVDIEVGPYTVKNYINPRDANHLHYYIWKWYSGIAGGSDEVIRHAISGEPGNSIKAFGPGITGAEQYKVSSYNRSRKKFTVLLYSGGANAKSWARISIPARIQRGWHYNNEYSTTDFRGEGFADGDKYQAHVVTKNISRENGSDQKVSVQKSKVLTVANGTLQATVGNIRKFTSIEFIKIE
jgi:hypothetical protein